MANQASTGFGFVPVYHRDGREYVASAIPCYLPSTDATNFAVGDPVILATQSGNSSNQAIITPSGAVLGGVGFDIGTLPTVGAITCGTSNYVSGVITHIGADPVDYKRPPYRKASTAAVVWVEISPDVVYEARILNLTTAPGITGTVGNTASIYAGAGVNTTTGVSTYGIDGATLQTSSGTTYQVRIIGNSRDILNNDLASANPIVLCMLNLSTEVLPVTAI